MAKVRQQNSIESAIRQATAALRIESIPNPTEEQKQQIHEAKVAAADIIDASGFTNLAQFADEDVEPRIQAEEEAEAEAIRQQHEEEENQLNQ